MMQTGNMERVTGTNNGIMETEGIHPLNRNCTMHNED